MRGNDISNRPAFVMGFRVEDFILEKERPKGLFKAFKKPVWNLTNHGQASLYRISVRHACAIHLYTVGITDPKEREIIKQALEGVYHNKLTHANDYQDLRRYLSRDRAVFYFDSDTNALSVVGSVGKHISYIPFYVS